MGYRVELMNQEPVPAMLGQPAWFRVVQPITLATVYKLLRPAMLPIVYCWRRTLWLPPRRTLQPPPWCTLRPTPRRTLRPLPRRTLRPPPRRTLRPPPRRCTLLLANGVKGFKGLKGTRCRCVAWVQQGSAEYCVMSTDIPRQPKPS